MNYTPTENYTNVNIYKRTFEERQVANSRDMIEQPHNHLGSNKEHAGFNPYQNNEGTVVGKFLPFKLQTLPLAGGFPTDGYDLTKFSLNSDCGS